MDVDDDDIYPEHEPAHGSAIKREYEDGEEEGEEVEDDESDDDINFIVDAKEESKAEPGPQAKSQPATAQAESNDRKHTATPTSAIKRESTPVSNINQISTTHDDGRPGTDFPARHTSTLDPNGNPVHPVTGKPILNTDFDTDFPTETSKPWRKPGADVTDYFNYGFDEFTWASYCLKKQQMPQEVKQINQEAEQMKAFVEGIGSGGMPAMPGMPGQDTTGAAGGMPQMPGMPSEQDMQQMFQAMMAQGMDPTSMDSNQFMQMMMSGTGGGAQFPQGQQPPTGPSGFGGGGGGGGYQDNYSGGRGRGRGGRRNWG